MTIYRNYLAVSYSEFQCLYNYGEITITAARLAAIPLLESGEPEDDPFHSRVLLGRSPAYDPNDEEGILMLETSELSTAGAGICPSDLGLFRLHIESVEKVVPLGERSFRILGARLREMGIELSPPYFEQSARLHRIDKIKQSSLNAGNSLVGLLLGDYRPEFPDELEDVLSLSLYMADYPEVEIPSFLKTKGEEPVLPALFSYTRHKPVHNPSTDCIEDLGICISNRYGKDAAVVVDYREAFGAVRERARDTQYSIVDILSEDTFRNYLNSIQEKYAAFFPFHPSCMTIFLKWKDDFHRGEDSINLRLLREECQSLVDAIGANIVGQSLWILGCYIGHDRMATFLYSSGFVDAPVFIGEEFDKAIVTPIDCATSSVVAGEPELLVEEADFGIKPKDLVCVSGSGSEQEGEAQGSDEIAVSKQMPSEKIVGENSPNEVAKEIVGEGERSKNSAGESDLNLTPSSPADSSSGSSGCIDDAQSPEKGQFDCFDNETHWKNNESTDSGGHQKDGNTTSMTKKKATSSPKAKRTSRKQSGDAEEKPVRKTSRPRTKSKAKEELEEEKN